MQLQRSKILAEKETLVKVYQTLLEEHRTLQTSYDDAVAEKDEALSRVKDARRVEELRRPDKSDVHLRAEIDHLRSEL